MIFDKQTNRWYLNEQHMKLCKAGLERNKSLQNRLPLSEKEVENGSIVVIDPIIKWQDGEHYRPSTDEETCQDEQNETLIDTFFAKNAHFLS